MIIKKTVPTHSLLYLPPTLSVSVPITVIPETEQMMVCPFMSSVTGAIVSVDVCNEPFTSVPSATMVPLLQLPRATELKCSCGKKILLLLIEFAEGQLKTVPLQYVP